MTKAVDDLETLELLGSTQWGLVTATQATHAGVSHVRLSRLVDRGTLQRARHGVYVLPSAPGGPLQGVRAAWLFTDSLPVGTKPTAVVSGQSAASVHGLGDLVPPVYEFSTPQRRQSSKSDVRYRLRELPETDYSFVDGLPVTTVSRTVRDLSTDGLDQEHLTGVVRDALARSTVTSLSAALAPSAARLGYKDPGKYLSELLGVPALLADRALNDALQQLSGSLVQSVTPQLEDSMKSALGEFAASISLLRSAGQIPDLDTSNLTAALLSEPFAAVREQVAKTLTRSDFSDLARTAAGTLTNAQSAEPRALPALEAAEEDAHGEPVEPGGSAQPTESGRRGAAEEVAERQAEHGSQEARRRS